jgi:hypothetical protein
MVEADVALTGAHDTQRELFGDTPHAENVSPAPI